MTASRRLAPLPLLLIGLAAIAALLLIPWVVQAQSQEVTPTADATGTNPPAKPTNLQSSAEHDSVTLTWTASTDQTVTHYAILRRNPDTDSSQVFHVIESNAGPGTSYTDGTVSASTTYIYRVKSVSPTGVSQWSGYVKAETPAAPDPTPTPAPTSTPEPEPEPQTDPVDLAPSGLTAALAEGGGAALTWTTPAADADSVTGYEILRAVGEGELATLADDTASTATSYTDATATQSGASYTYKVKAIRGEERSQAPGQAQVQVPHDPEDLAPSNLTAALADGSGVALTWTAPAENADNVTGYEILRAVGEGALATLAADTGNTATTYTDATATVAGETYAYQVKAIRGEDRSQASGQAQVQVPHDPVDLKPTGLMLSLVENKVTLSWTAPAEDAESVDGYEILRRRPMEGESALATLVADTESTATTYTDDDANEAGVRYVYRVKALRGDDVSLWSNFDRIDLPADYAPDPTPTPEPESTTDHQAPTGLSAALAAGGGVALTWTAPSEDADSVTGYEVLRAVGAGEMTTLAADTASTTTTYTDATATEAGETYAYRVKAIRGEDRSQASAQAEVQVPHDPVDLAPTGLTAVVLTASVVVVGEEESTPTTSVGLSWTAPAEDADSVTGYEILRAVGEGELATLVDDTGSAATAYTDTTATEAGETYAYKVKAIRGEDRSQASGQARVQLPHDAVDLAPSDLAAEAVDGGGVDLSWTSPAEDAGSVTGYEILRAVGEGEMATLVADTASTATTYTDATATEEGETYAYRVKAVRGQARSQASNRVALIPVEPTATPENLKPTNLTFEIREDGVTLAWDAPAADAGSVTGYRVVRRRPNQGENEWLVWKWDTGSTETTYRDGYAQTHGEYYMYRVRALRGNDYSKMSNRVDVRRPQATPQTTEWAPSNLQAQMYFEVALGEEGVTTQVKLTWAAPAEGTEWVRGYEVQRATCDGGFAALVSDTGSTETTYADSTAEAGETYTYRVKARRPQGKSLTSNTWTLLIPGGNGESDCAGNLQVGGTLEFVPEVYQLSRHETPLVKNTGQTALGSGGLLGVDAENEAQGFTTGPNPDGYTLSAIGISFDTIADTSNAGSELTASLYDGTPNMLVPTLIQPNSALCTLNDPSSFSSSGVQTFTAPTTCPTLAANTIYFVVLERAIPANLDYFPANRQIFYDVTWDTDEDSGSAAGWSIEDTAWYFQDGFWQDETTIPTRTVKMMIEVEGAPVQPYLIKNTGQTSYTTVGDTLDSTRIKVAQAFTTGANTFGYTLGSIGFDFLAILNVNIGNQLTVTLNTEDADGDPGTALCTLSDPESFTALGVQTFYVPATCPTILPSTTYFAVIQRVNATIDAIRLSLTSSSDEDNGGAAGWSIDNGRYTLSSGGSWIDEASDPYQIEVRGVVRTTADPRLQEFNTLDAAGNDFPVAIWSDGTTMWVVDLDDIKIYAYEMATKARDADKEFNTLDAAGNDNPQGLWSDGTTMWVTGRDDQKLYAYDMDTKARVPGEDFNNLYRINEDGEVPDAYPRGIWSDGDIMWVADNNDAAIYAYDMDTKAHVPGEDITGLRSVGNAFPGGLWGDETTLFATEFTEGIYAYWLSIKAPNTARHITFRAENDRGRGIWSDGTTMWVADSDDAKIYAYELPAPVPEPSDLVTVKNITDNSAIVRVDVAAFDYPEVISITINRGGHSIYKHPDASAAFFMLRGLQPETEYTVVGSFGDGPRQPLGEVTFTTPHAQVSGIKVSDLTHTSASVTVSLAGADVDKRDYINYWVSRDRSDPERTYYLRYKRETDSAFNGWSDPVTLTFSGSTEVALSGLDPGTVYDVQVYEDPEFPVTPPFARPFAFKESTWLEQFGAFSTPPLPATLAFEAEMTVGTDSANSFDGFSDETGSLSATTFEVGGVEYTVKQAGIVTAAPATWAFLVDPALPFDSFTLTLGSTELSSSSATRVDSSAGRQYLWSATNPNWASGAMVDVKLDIGLIDICGRSPAVAHAIREATPSFDFCHMTSPIDLANLTELDLPGGRGTGLKAGDFEGLSGLTRLDLSYYILSLQQLPVGVFDGLDSLTHLDISHTGLMSLDLGVFEGLDNLVELDLSDTHLQRGTVPVGVFDPLDNLEVLRLTNLAEHYENTFSNLDDDIFRGLVILRELDVGDSTPLRDSPRSLLPLTSLTTLNGQAYTRPADPPANFQYASGRIDHELGFSKTCYAVTLKWGAPTGVSGITGYRVLRNLGAESLSRYAKQIATTGASARTFVDGRNADVCFGGVGSGPNVSYFVAAITAGGDSFPARVRVDQTRAFPTSQVPNTPTLRGSLYDLSVAKSPNGYKVRLQWNDLHHNITGYEISFRGSSSAAWRTIVVNAGNVLEYDLESVPIPPSSVPRTAENMFLYNAFRDQGDSIGFTDGREFRIRALNAAGSSGWSNVVRPFR